MADDQDLSDGSTTVALEGGLVGNDGNGLWVAVEGRHQCARAGGHIGVGSAAAPWDASGVAALAAAVWLPAPRRCTRRRRPWGSRSSCRWHGRDRQGLELLDGQIGELVDALEVSLPWASRRCCTSCRKWPRTLQKW